MKQRWKWPAVLRMQGTFFMRWHWRHRVHIQSRSSHEHQHNQDDVRHRWDLRQAILRYQALIPLHWENNFSGACANSHKFPKWDLLFCIQQWIYAWFFLTTIPLPPACRCTQYPRGDAVRWGSGIPGGACAILSEKQPEGGPCGLKTKTNDKVATKVADAMTDFIDCPEGKWANPTATACPEMSGSGSRTLPMGWVKAVGLAVTCIFITI